MGLFVCHFCGFSFILRTFLQSYSFTLYGNVSFFDRQDGTYGVRAILYVRAVFGWPLRWRRWAFVSVYYRLFDMEQYALSVCRKKGEGSSQVELSH